MIRVRVPAGILAIVFGLLLLPSMASALKFEPGAGATFDQVGTVNAVATGDFNEDGLTDFATASTASSTFVTPGIRIMLSAGDGSFTDGGTLDGGHAAGPYNVLSGDFNGDGHVDLIYTRNADLAQYNVFLGDGTGAFTASGGFSYGSGDQASRNSLGIGDLNGDARDDVVLGEKSGNYKVAIANPAGNGFDITNGSVGGSIDCFSVAMGDFNGDGDTDVALGMGSTNGNGYPEPGGGGSVNILLGDSTGALTTVGAGNPHPQAAPLGVINSLAVADFNNDGRDDLAATSLNLNVDDFKYDSSLQKWMGSPASVLGAATVMKDTSLPVPPPVNPTRERLTDVNAADFNGDGKPDLALLDAVAPNGPNFNQALVYAGDGSGGFSNEPGSPYDLNVSTTLFSFELGDINGDGSPDVVAGGLSAGAPNLLSTPDVTPDPGSLDFGNSKVGQTSNPQTITFNNNGGPQATLSNFSVSGPDAIDFYVTRSSACDVSFANPCLTDVYLTPSAAGTRSATLTVSVSGGPDLVIPLGGTGVQSEATFSPSPVDFGDVPTGTSKQITVTLTSSGLADLTTSTVSVAGTDGGLFTLSQDDCDFTTLAPNATCTVKVTFAPGANTGAKTATLEVVNDGTGAQSVTLQGVGTDAAITPADTAYDLGTLPAGTPTGNGVSIGFTSSGTTTLHISGFTITGPNAADFSLGSTNNCLVTKDPVPPGDSCSQVAIFKPGLSGGTNRSATLNVASNARSGPLHIALSGTASGGGLAFSPDEFNFGDVKVGQPSAAKTITVTSTGATPVAIDGVGINGPDSGDFQKVSNSCDNAILPAGGTCQVSVTFTPSRRGVENAEMRATTDSGNFYAQLEGNGIDPAGTLSPPAYGFGSVTLGSSSAPRIITLNSTGADPLSVTSASITGTDADSFSLASATTCNGSQLASCDFSVTFTPIGAAGPRSATLSVATNAGTLTSTLAGTAAAVPVPPRASLGVKAPKKVRKGKALVVTTKVKGLSAGAIAGIVVAAKVSGPAKAPKKVKISSLGQGSTKTIKLKVPVKKSAKPGKKVTVSVTITSGGRKLASGRIKSKVTK